MPFLSQYTFLKKVNFLLRDLLVFFLMVSATLLTAYFRKNDHIQMNMSFLYFYLYILPFRIIFSNLLKLCPQVALYPGDQYSSQVSGDPDDMILGFVYSMGYLYSFILLFYQGTTRRNRKHALIPTFTGGEFSLD